MSVKTDVGEQGYHSDVNRERVGRALLDLFSKLQIVFEEPAFGTKARERTVIGRTYEAFKACRTELEAAARQRQGIERTK